MNKVAQLNCTCIKGHVRSSHLRQAAVTVLVDTFTNMAGDCVKRFASSRHALQFVCAQKIPAKSLRVEDAVKGCAPRQDRT